MENFRHKIYFFGIIITLVSLLVPVPSGSPLATLHTNATSSQTTYADNNNTIPFDNFYLLYNLKAKENNLPVFDINLMVNYTKITTVSNTSFDYQQQMVLQSFLFALIGERQENATFFENSSTRLMQLNDSEGTYIQLLIFNITAYNDSINGYNWDPFWIVPQDVNQSYPIYSFDFNLTQTTELTHSDLPLFNTSRTVLVFHGQQQLNSSTENITNTFGLIYDNLTGILVKGVMDSTVIGLNTTNQYYANFELAKTNAFAKFTSSTVSNTTTPNPIATLIPKQLKQPNYLLLVFIIALPILLTIVRFLRLKEISGGMK